MTDTPKAATAQDVLATLQSIDHGIKALLAHFGAGRSQGASGAPPDTRHVAAIASDADLDGQHGNPEVKAKSPRDWTGESQQGKRFSECPPEYLDLVASRLDYFAESNAASENADDVKKARYNRLDASRARGWAARLRGGWKAPAASEAFPSDSAPLTNDDIPF